MPSKGPCPFCSLPGEFVAFDHRNVVGIWDAFPVSPGHMLLVPRRHLSSWFDATEDEQASLTASIAHARSLIVQRLSVEGNAAPSGFNVGFNVGSDAGQTVDHFHIHVIPRFPGDSPDPAGGVRWVIPEKGNYRREAAIRRLLEQAPHAQGVITGSEKDPLLPHLKSHLLRARCFDAAVAFVLPRGVEVIREALDEFLERDEPSPRMRLLTGDYLGATDPDALQLLLDVQSAHPQRVEVRVYEAKERSFHPKFYLFELEDDSGVAFIGSSNLSQAALESGVEWNYRLLSSTELRGFRDAKRAFTALFRDPRTLPLSRAWIEAYALRRPSLRPEYRPGPDGASVVRDRAGEGEEPVAIVDEALDAVQPRPIQAEALEALALTRSEGNGAGLVVLATGLGKTWLSAFDVDRYPGRALFIAHRDEILKQALRIFRRVMPTQRLGLFNSESKDVDADVVFASVQTLSRLEHLRTFPRDYFAHVTVDEFHHASADTYRRILDHFRPGFLLGLTATPERTDGGDLLALCGENLVFRADLQEGIERGQLVPFDYFGVPDETDFEQIPWRSGRFEPEELSQALATTARAENALAQIVKRGGEQIIAFCASIAHADFMAAWLREQGYRAAAVHTGQNAIPRTEAVEKLDSGALQILCPVDMFNEGVDIPRVDTVLMLRPTESRVLWLQQIGRGLRLSPGKDRLSIIDYVGNHRTFLKAVQALFGLGETAAELRRTLGYLAKKDGHVELPGGCSVTYDLEALELLQKLARKRAKKRALDLEQWVEDFLEQYQQRPTAYEAWSAKFKPWKDGGEGGWFGLLEELDYLSPQEKEALEAHGSWLARLATTRMTKSYKMILFQAWIRSGLFPAPIPIDHMVEAFGDVARRSGPVALDLSAEVSDRGAMRRLIIDNPVKYLADLGVRTDGETISLELSRQEARVGLTRLARELVEWRLAEYLYERRGDRRAHIADFDGMLLDARFSTDRGDSGGFIVYVESRGGTGGTKGARNTQYTRGLQVLLARLKELEATLASAELATRQVAGQALEPPAFRLPVELKSVPETDALASALQRAQGNNQTRRIRLLLRVPNVDSAATLQRRLAGHD